MWQERTDIAAAEAAKGAAKAEKGDERGGFYVGESEQLQVERREAHGHPRHRPHYALRTRAHKNTVKQHAGWLNRRILRCGKLPTTLFHRSLFPIRKKQYAHMKAYCCSPTEVEKR